MDRYLLDSSAILDVLEGNAQGKEMARILANAEATTSIICYCEVLNKADGERKTNAKALLEKLFVFDLTLTDGQTACRMQENARRKGGHVPTIDCLIAATAANRKATLLTSDSDFQRIDGVGKKII